MEELSQEYLLSIIFKNAIDREELLQKKIEHYYDAAKNKDMREMLKTFKKNSQEHISMMKDKMIKLRIHN